MGHCLMMRKGEVHTAPVTGVLASSLAVGSVVKLMEGGTAVEYLVVNQGIPGNSNLYDASCDGTWLLRKNAYNDGMQWSGSSGNNNYADSLVHTWLNGDFFNLFGTVEQKAIKEVKIPYCVGNNSATVNSGANGLSAKVFLLSGNEVYISHAYADNSIPNDGSVLDYFSDTATVFNRRRSYWEKGSRYISNDTRSPSTASNSIIYQIRDSGVFTTSNPVNQGFYRPAVILPSNALFDETTMLLKGVK